MDQKSVRELTLSPTPDEEPVDIILEPTIPELSINMLDFDPPRVAPISVPFKNA